MKDKPVGMKDCSNKSSIFSPFLSSSPLKTTKMKPKNDIFLPLYVQKPIGIKIPLKIGSKNTRKTKQKPNRLYRAAAETTYPPQWS